MPPLEVKETAAAGFAAQSMADAVPELAAEAATAKAPTWTPVTVNNGNKSMFTDSLHPRIGSEAEQASAAADMASSGKAGAVGG